MKIRICAFLKKSNDWQGFWISPDHKVFLGRSHQKIIEDALGPDATYDFAFDLGWVRGYFQSDEVGFEAKTILNTFSFLQSFIQSNTRFPGLKEVYLDLNGISYNIPIKDFLSMNKISALRSYKYSTEFIDYRFGRKIQSFTAGIKARL